MAKLNLGLMFYSKAATTCSSGHRPDALSYVSHNEGLDCIHVQLIMKEKKVIYSTAVVDRNRFIHTLIC